MLEIRLLGTFDLRQAGKPIALSSRPAQSLFAYLVLNAGTAHRREKLAGLLWPDSMEETARDNLRHALWRIRKALPSDPSAEYLLTDDLTITFKASTTDYWLDTAELENLSEKASIAQLLAALQVYQGELLPGFYEEWVVLEREHLRAVFEHHMARLMSLLQDEKRWLDILDWGERWIKLGQKPEPAYRALMIAHAAKGEMSKVAATYERCVKSLYEIGIEPSEQTKELFTRLKAGKESIESGYFVPIRDKRIELPKTNIPVPLTSFIGREKEVDQVTKLLKKKRLVTLTGSGGVGKTRLAIRSSNELLNDFDDGVWWADLVGLKDDSLVLQAVAQVVSVREVPNQSLNNTLIEYFQTKHTLLILDNCEHLIAGCAQLANSLLNTCPNLKILITSREGLGLTGEVVWHVPTLTLPAPEHIPTIGLLSQYESIRLFIERAAAVKTDFTLTEHNAPFVAQVCHQLDGIPLAIELAAARVKVLSVEQIAARLDDRFELLTGGSRTTVPRHQTLRAAMDWGYDLLPEIEQSLFRRLAVFAGSWTLEDVQAVCSNDGIESNEVLDLLMHLVDKSLVIMQEHEGEARCHMLETVREYARRKFPHAGEEVRVRNRHLDFFMRLAEEAEPRLHSAEQGYWLRRLDLAHDNLRAALDWSITGGDIEAGLRLAGALWLFWDIRGYQLEARAWMDRLLSKCHSSAPSPSALAQAKVLYVAGHLRQRQGDLERAQKHYVASLTIYRQLEAEIQTAVVLRGLGEIAQDEGDLRSAKDYYEQSLSLVRALGNIKETNITLSHLAIVALSQDDNEQAIALCTEALSIGQERGDNRTIVIALTILGFALWSKGELEQATIKFNEALVLQAQLTDKRVVQYELIGMALVAFAKSDPARAARLFGAADSLREGIGTPLPPSQRPRYEVLVASVRSQLGQAVYDALWTEGRALTLQQAIEYALER